MAPGAQPTPLASTSSTIGDIARSILGCNKDCADKAVNNNNNNEPGTCIPLVECKTKVAGDVSPTSTLSSQNTTVTPELNDRVRNLIGKSFKQLRTNLNVLVLGSNSSGKTSLINSMNMAYHQEWKDRARYCPGRAHVLQECVVFRNRSRGSNVVFWDTRGFENIHEDSHAVLILRYILEGRIDPKCLSCVLLMTKKMMKERYTEKNPRRRIDLVLFVSDLTQEPNRHLMDLVEQAISDSKRYSSIRNVPILSVCTKADSVREIPCCEKLNEYNLELLRYQRRHPNALDDLDLDQVVGRRPVIVIDNYWSEMDPVSDEPEFTLFRKFDPQLDNPQPDDNTSLDTEPDFTSTGVHPGQVTPCPARDSRLLSIWNEIIQSTAACGGGHDMRKRNYSPARRTLLGCLPFSISNNVFRLRSSSI